MQQYFGTTGGATSQGFVSNLAASNQHNNVKLPLSVKGKSALSDIGVDRVYNGDTVYVEGYNQAFKITKYDNDTIKYIPFI